MSKSSTSAKEDLFNNSEKVARKNKLIANLLVAFLLGTMFFLAVFSMKDDSATIDEVAHIPAGYSYLTEGDYRLNPEHPPLLKMLSATPLLFMNLPRISEQKYWNNLSEWSLGVNFLYHSGIDAEAVTFFARIPPILLMILLGFLLFRWAEELYGKKTALFVLFLYVFSPNILAHGRLVTTDLPAALGFVLTIYAFGHFLISPSKKTVLFSGLALGTALLLKFSTFVLIPLLFILIFYKIIAFDDQKVDKKSLFHKLVKGYLVTIIIAFLLVWIVYLPITYKMNADFVRQIINSPLDSGIIIDLKIRRLLYFLTGVPVLRPFGWYLFGLLASFLRAFNGKVTFLFGYFVPGGTTFFFPLTWLVKTPIPEMLFFLFSIYALIKEKFRDRADKFWTSIYLTVIVIYLFLSLISRLNIGFRHLLPILPFIFLLIGRTMYPFLQTPFKEKLYLKIIFLILCFWYLISSLLAFPSYLAYFNESSFIKPKNEMFIDSSLDWGQDLKRLSDYAHENKINQIKIDYFGKADPRYYLPEAEFYHVREGPTTGWLAVSSTYLSLSPYLERIGKGEWDYTWLDSFKPRAIFGDSIYLYYISQDDLLSHPPESIKYLR